MIAKIRKRLIVSLLLLVMVLLMLIHWLPHWVGTDSFRLQIQAYLASNTDVQLEYDQIQLSLLPTPQIALDKCRLQIGNRAKLSIPRLLLHLSLRALIAGRIQPAHISAQQPEVWLQLDAKAQVPDTPSQTSDQVPLDWVPAVAVALLENTPSNLEIDWTDGSVTLLLPNGNRFEQKHISATIQGSSNQIDLAAHCRGAFFNRLQINANIDRQTQAIKGQVALSRLAFEELPAQWEKKWPSMPTRGNVDIKAQIEANGDRSLTAAIHATSARLAWGSPTSPVQVEGGQLKAALRWTRAGFQAEVQDLTLANPRLQLSGHLHRQNDPAPKFELKLFAEDLDAQQVVTFYRKLGRQSPGLNKTFEIIRAGQISTLHIAVAGSDASVLKRFDNWQIKGEMQASRIVLDHLKLDLKEASGIAEIKNGVLHVSHAGARLGNTTGTEGRLRVGLTRKQTPFHLDIQINADLSQLPPVLSHLVKAEAFQRELNQISNVEGGATGRLQLDETPQGMNYCIDVSDFALSGRSQRLPHPIRLHGGPLRLDPNRLDIHHLTAEMQTSTATFDRVALNFADTVQMNLAGGRAELRMQEVTRWYPQQTDRVLQTFGVSRLSGDLSVNGLNVEGPFSAPENWQFRFEANPRTLSVETEPLPAPLSITSGIVFASSKHFEFKQVQAAMLDAEARLSGQSTAANPLSAGVDIQVHQAHLGEQASQWLGAKLNRPEEMRLQTPLSIAEGRIFWQPSKQVVMQGQIGWAAGPKMAIDLEITPTNYTLKHLQIEDEFSKASIYLSGPVDFSRMQFHFQGKLTQQTMNALWRDKRLQTGYLSGDLRGTFAPAKPFQSTIEGNLQGEDLLVPIADHAPMHIESIDFEAIDRRVQIKRATIQWQQQTLQLAGWADFKNRPIVVDLDLHADTFHYDLWRALGRHLTKEGAAKDAQEPAAPMFRGDVIFAADHFSLGPYGLHPFRVKIEMRPRRTVLSIENAAFCGIFLPGSVVVEPDRITVDVKPTAVNQHLEQTFSCFQKKDQRIDGRFTLKGHLLADSALADLLSSLKGPLKFSAGKGRLHQLGPTSIISRLFVNLSLTELFKGQLPDLSKDGFAFTSMKADMHLKQGYIHFDTLQLNGTGMNIVATGKFGIIDQSLDFNLLVSPLKAVDTIVRNLPGVNYILDGTLVGIPYGLRGTLKSPRITVLNPTAVGSRLLDIAKRTLKLPIQWIKPVLPK